MGYIATASYLLGGVGFLGLLVLLLTRYRGRLTGGLIVMACSVSVVWSATFALHAATGMVTAMWLFVLEVVRGAAWLGLLLGLLGGAESRGLPRLARVLVHAVWLGALTYGISRGLLTRGEGAAQAYILGYFLVALVGLVLVEQLFRNTTPERRWAMKYLCLGVGGLFAYDLYLYANGLLFRALDGDLWQARGAVNAMIVPLIAIAAARNPEGSAELAISRRLAFYTTSLGAVGVYLLAMAAGGYYIRLYGGSWGAVAQIVFLFGALVILLTTLFSGQARAWLKVFLSKHFYHYKYDYREEWLRLIRLLFSSGASDTLPQRALRAVADIVESPVAGLWLARDSGYEPASGDLAGPDSAVEPADSPMVRFMTEREWIVHLDEYREGNPEYAGLELPDWLLAERRAWLVLPLLQERRLLGFMVLSRPRAGHKLTWEDFDLLKTVGRQVAGVLAQHEAAQELAVTRQFETYNRLAAFIMHDLKNLIAQQSLVVKNAAKHKNNPEFVEDAIRTVDNSVRRMNRLLEQLRRRGEAVAPRRCRLNALCADVARSGAQRKPAPLFSDDAPDIEVVFAPESLAMVLGHVVSNAQDATDPDGKVEIRLWREGGQAVIEIADDGSGMEEQFVRERLFRPFDTTKGSKGMGIGAYQVREIVRAQGGDVHVDSRPGEGTRFQIRLPLAGGGSPQKDDSEPERSRQTGVMS